ncbi:DUF1152 domain-containing protein [Stetteria hydrogenophila]
MGRPRSLEEIASTYRRVLVFGAGGGGDAAGAVHLYLKLRRLGAEPLLGSIVWERFVVDPAPGPVRLEELVNAEPIGWSAALVTGDTFALRLGREVKPQLARVAGVLGVKALAIDVGKGAVGVAEALRSASEALGVEAAIAVDVGGDSLARGCEETLWSPLADAVSLSGLASSGIPGFLAIHAPGADGELPRDLVLARIAEAAARGGLIGVYGLNREEVEVLDRVMEHVYSEASRIPYLAFKGEYGVRTIRGGTRRVTVDPSMAATYLLDAGVAVDLTPLPRLVEGTRSIAQAREALNRACIYTELDLELDVNRLLETGQAESRESIDLVELRRRGAERLRRHGCQPPPGCGG